MEKTMEDYLLEARVNRLIGRITNVLLLGSFCNKL